MGIRERIGRAGSGRSLFRPTRGRGSADDAEDRSSSVTGYGRESTFRTICAVLLLSIAFALGCSDDATTDPPPPEVPESWKGITLTPRSFGADDFLEFLSLTGQTGAVVSWGGDWIELADTVDGAPVAVAEMAILYDFVPLIGVQVFDPGTGELLRPLDETNRTLYKESAVHFCRKYAPPYFAIGGEVNILASSSPDDFEAFVSLYHDVQVSVREASLETKVFTIFQLEKMKGLNGGLFGGTNDPAANQWNLLERFPDPELVGFTTYPCLIYGDPSEIPADYYSEIAAHTDLPVAFTEIGWHSAATIPGWESSETEQAAFVKRYFELISDLSVEGSIWSFLYDSTIQLPFDSMGLRRPDGTPRPSWDAWIEAD